MKYLSELKIKGEVTEDSLHRIAYATDASAYREIPLGVAYPCDEEDVKEIVRFASQNKIALIPRAGGTSLAGQVVGDGLVVDISRNMTRILEINPAERWIRVEPGVILDDLNAYCKPYGLLFGPETSTANRCCMGGMVGNNSCGSHSLVYGSTRDHLLEARVVLSDTSVAILRGVTPSEIDQKLAGDTLESNIYRGMIALLSNPNNQQEINNNYPDPSLRRRNTGYALDELLRCNYFDDSSDQPFNICRLLAGSEGTLAFITELKLNLVSLPPAEKALICVHCSTLEESFEVNLVALEHFPTAIELIDSTILELSRQNISQNKNRFFIQGTPAAIVIIEIAESSREALEEKATAIEKSLRLKKLGTHYPRVDGSDINRVWELRKAGLGLLSNIVGDAKPVSVIEDTAVAPSRLPHFISDMKMMLDSHNLSCVYHAHIATGELHLRPILNLKREHDRKLFRCVATSTVELVKRHKGSLSGEHGDGRLRGEFITSLLGTAVYELLKEAKNIWDPNNIFNPGKIIDPPQMDTSLRYQHHNLNIKTYFDFSAQGGWLSAIEQCNGSGDCRKSLHSGGTMCPTYQATGDETMSTRARANTLRELIINPQKGDRFNQKDIIRVLDNCISCKACKSECPSNIDMARLKAEYLQQHYDTTKSVNLRTLIIANITAIQKIGIKIPKLYNTIITNRLTSSVIKYFTQFSQKRSLPTVNKISLRSWLKKHPETTQKNNGRVYLFADEFTNYNDTEVGIKFIKLLRALNYEVIIPNHKDSGRILLSKGLLKRARRVAEQNVTLLKDIITPEAPLIGIEPSCILSFRDEYPTLVCDKLKEDACQLAKSTLLYDEFIVREIELGKITSTAFTKANKDIKLHGHCHQKSLASIAPSAQMLTLPTNYTVEIIPSGCCGMAGSFGYEKEHYDLSMQIGESLLFPAIRKCKSEITIAAPGTSCRTQIKDGTGRIALHPIEILYDALEK